MVELTVSSYVFQRSWIKKILMMKNEWNNGENITSILNSTKNRYLAFSDGHVWPIARGRVETTRRGVVRDCWEPASSQVIQTLGTWPIRLFFFFANASSSRHSIFTAPGHHTSMPLTDTKREQWLWENIVGISTGGFQISGSHTLSVSFHCYEDERHWSLNKRYFSHGNLQILSHLKVKKTW